MATGAKGETRIDFPEIEQVSKNGDVRPFIGMKPGAAKSRFTNIALKLMSSLYVTDEAVQEENGEDAAAAAAVTSSKDELMNSLTVPLADKRKASISRSRGSLVESELGMPATFQSFAPTPLRRQQKSRFASLVRLTKYRKMVRSRAGSVCSDVSSEAAAEDEKIELPEKPRFCATLSPEAQYATMKGYEDLLLTKLKEQQAEAATQACQRLYRVKTPHHKVVSVHLNHLEKKQEEILREFQAQRLTTKRHSNSWFDATDSRSSLPPVHTPAAAGTDDDDGKSWGKVPKDKQLWLTHRFQCAMDILDKVREEQGMLVTSPRYKQRVTNPIANYNSWSHDWSREFKLEYSKN